MVNKWTDWIIYGGVMPKIELPYVEPPVSVKKLTKGKK